MSQNEGARKDGGPDRRDFLAGLGATTAAGALAGRGATAAATPIGGGSGWEYKSVAEMAQALGDKQVSSLELVDAAIARIEALDGRFNAVVVRDFDRAREAAKAADMARSKSAGDQPLLGIPMTVKEQFNIAGLPTSWGSPRFKDWRPAEDALAVQRLKAAGAVILGKTNVPLHLADWQSFNEVYGTTNNPGIPAARLVVRQGARRFRWPRAMCPWSWAPISAARCGRRRIIAACFRTSRASTWCRNAVPVRPTPLPFPRTANSP